MKSMDRLVKILRKISIRRRLAYAFLILCIIPIGVMIITSVVVEFLYFKESLVTNYSHFAYESNIRVNDSFEQLELRFQYLKDNNDILADLYLYAREEGYQSEEVISRIENTIRSIMSNQDEISSTLIFSEQLSTFSYSKEGSDIEEIEREKLQKQGWHSLLYKGENLMYRIEDVEIDYTTGNIVTFVAFIDMEAIELLLKEATGIDTQQITIVDSTGVVVAGNEVDSTEVAYESIIPIANTDFAVINSFIKQPYSLKNFFVISLLFIIIIIISGIALYLVNESIKIPLTRLLERIQKVNSNNQIYLENVEFDESSMDEHIILNNEFTSMLSRLNELMDETYISKIHETELRTRIKELELVSLQQRINPHFFYNVLDNVFWMAQMKDYEEIGDMISALGEFFKTSVSEKGAYVSIQTEIENVKSYVYLQKIMHKGQFEDEWAIDPDIAQCKTVKLILQPIIENCIVHGFEGLEDGGLIQVFGRRTADVITFEVKDNGRGFSEDICKKIEMKMNSTILGVGDSIGMRNVNQRIKIYFGEQYGITIRSKINEGTTISLCIPVKE